MTKDRSMLFPFARYPLLFGHRGCSGIAPENTMPAFQKILDHGIPGVELDIQLARTGEVVVFHDSNLKRITGKDALVTETDYTEIRSLDAGSWFSTEFAGTRIPLLDEVLDLLGDSVYYDIEIKHWDRRGGDLEEKLVETVNRRGIRDRTLVSSFNPHSTRAVRTIDPSIHTAHIYTRHPGFPWYLSTGAGRLLCRPEVLKPNRHRLNPWSVLWKKRVLGFPLVTWTEDDPEAVQRYLDLGVDGIITNVPQRIMPIIAARRDADSKIW